MPAASLAVPSCAGRRKREGGDSFSNVRGRSRGLFDEEDRRKGWGSHRRSSNTIVRPGRQVMVLRLLIIVSLGATVLLSGWLLRHVRTDTESVAGPATHHPDLFVKNFTITQMDSAGLPRQRLHSPRMDHFPDDDSMELETPYLQIYRPGQPDWRIRSERGWISPGGTVIKLLGTATISRDAAPGYRSVDVMTRDIVVQSEQEIAETAQPATYISAGQRVDAVGVRAFLKEDRVVLLSDVRGRFESERD
jgi:lipopolysaccharide export system protein LptC